MTQCLSLQYSLLQYYGLYRELRLVYIINHMICSLHASHCSVFSLLYLSIRSLRLRALTATSSHLGFNFTRGVCPGVYPPPPAHLILHHPQARLGTFDTKWVGLVPDDLRGWRECHFLCFSLCKVKGKLRQNIFVWCAVYKLF